MSPLKTSQTADQETPTTNYSANARNALYPQPVKLFSEPNKFNPHLTSFQHYASIWYYKVLPPLPHTPFMYDALYEDSLT
jgi:hypothetical protein